MNRVYTVGGAKLMEKGYPKNKATAAIDHFYATRYNFQVRCKQDPSYEQIHKDKKLKFAAYFDKYTVVMMEE